MGTFPAFLSAWGPVDMGFGSGQGVKCDHSEHLYGEFWHRAFIVAADTPTCNYLISFGSNIEASGGVVGVWRHANARVRGSSACRSSRTCRSPARLSAQWVPIKPKTDPAFLYALIHVMLHECRASAWTCRSCANAPPRPTWWARNGYFLRDRATRKPLVWDETTGRAVAHDTPGIERAARGQRTQVDAIEVGPDDEVLAEGLLEGRTAFDRLVEHMRKYSPEWATGRVRRAGEPPSARCPRIRRARLRRTDHRHRRPHPALPPGGGDAGQDGQQRLGRLRVLLGPHLLACLVGALEVPGGTMGTTVRLNRPMSERLESVKRLGPDGFMDYPMNPTDKASWSPRAQHPQRLPHHGAAGGQRPWAQALGPTHFSWMFLDGTPKGLPTVTFPDVWFVYRTNPAISFWDTPALGDKIARFPFVVAMSYTRDETNHYADILLPDATDLESLQLLRIGGTKYVEQFWDHEGYALRQPVVQMQGQARDFTDIATELAAAPAPDRYNNAINRGAAA
jgi:phenylacetyl-CoA:acceptor oxidoreductase